MIIIIWYIGSIIDLIDYVYRIGNIAVLTDRPCN